MDDRGLDEFKGEVDFDFFDDDSDDENKPKKDAVLGKPPAARKSPKPPTPSKLPAPDLTLDLKTPGKKDELSDSDSYRSYSSDSSVTETDSDSDSGHDRPRHGNRSGSKTKQSSDSVKKNDKNKVISRSASSSEDSFSESESDTESFSKVSSVQTSTGNNKNKSKRNSKKSQNERDSASAYSDSHSDVESESKPVHVPSGSKSRERPMTSKNSRRNQNADSWTNGLEGSEKKNDVERPNDKESRKGRFKKERYSDSESEITDVSPLNSAPNSPRQKRRNKKNREHYKSNGHAGSNEQEESFNESERLDLNVLVDAVSELDKDKRIKANTRRVMFAPPKASDKKENYSYSNERAKMIEKENRRLLNEILQHVEMRDKPPQHVRYQKPVIRRLTPSAINREREQRKIESENLAFLRRLKQIKPTKGMSRAEHEREYEKTMLYGVPISMAHGSRPKSRSSTPWDEMSMTSSSRMGSRTRSLTSVHSAASSTIGSTQSTFRRPTSAKRSQRAEWNDRW